jgi:hypothetical protein
MRYFVGNTGKKAMPQMRSFRMLKNDSNHTENPIYDGDKPKAFVNQIMDILHNPPHLVLGVTAATLLLSATVFLR